MADETSVDYGKARAHAVTPVGEMERKSATKDNSLGLITGGGNVRVFEREGVYKGKNLGFQGRAGGEFTVKANPEGVNNPMVLSMSPKAGDVYAEIKKGKSVIVLTQAEYRTSHNKSPAVPQLLVLNQGVRPETTKDLKMKPKKAKRARLLGLIPLGPKKTVVTSQVETGVVNSVPLAEPVKDIQKYLRDLVADESGDFPMIVIPQVEGEEMVINGGMSGKKAGEILKPMLTERLSGNDDLDTKGTRDILLAINKEVAGKNGSSSEAIPVGDSTPLS